MKYLFLLLMIVPMFTHAENDFTSKAKELLNQVKDPMKKKVLQENLKKFQSKDSLGGTTVTETEFNTLKEFSEEDL